MYLCTVLIQNPNFLILDEPTNDLDIVTLNVLENFLLDFPGCLLVVSHDRYFMDKIVDHLFVFEQGKIRDFPGNYSDYREYSMQKPSETSKKEETASPKKEKEKAEKTTTLSYNEQKEFKRLEREIAQLEKDKKQVQDAFLTELSGEEIDQKSMELKNIEEQIDEKTERWFELGSRD